MRHRIRKPEEWGNNVRILAPGGAAHAIESAHVHSVTSKSGVPLKTQFQWGLKPKEDRLLWTRWMIPRPAFRRERRHTHFGEFN